MDSTVSNLLWGAIGTIVGGVISTLVSSHLEWKKQTWLVKWDLFKSIDNSTDELLRSIDNLLDFNVLETLCLGGDVGARRLMLINLTSRDFHNNKVLIERIDRVKVAYNNFASKNTDCLIFGPIVYSEFRSIHSLLDPEETITFSALNRLWQVLKRYISLYLLYDQSYTTTIIEHLPGRETPENFFNKRLVSQRLIDLQDDLSNLLQNKDQTKEDWSRVKDQIEYFRLILLSTVQGKEIFLEERNEEITPFYFFPEDSREMIRRAKSDIENKIYSNNHETKK